MSVTELDNKAVATMHESIATDTNQLLSSHLELHWL